MCPANFLQRDTLAQHMLQQRIVIEHINPSRMLPQTLLQIRDHASSIPASGKGLKRNSTVGSAGKANSVASPQIDSIAKHFCDSLRYLQILSCAASIQRRQQFHAHDAAKGIIGSHQQRPSFARAEIDEDEFAKIEARLLRYRPRSFRGTERIPSVDTASGKIPASDRANPRRARGVDAMLPIVFRIAIALPSPLRSRVANKLNQARSAVDMSPPREPSRAAISLHQRHAERDTLMRRGVEAESLLPSMLRHHKRSRDCYDSPWNFGCATNPGGRPLVAKGKSSGTRTSTRPSAVSL